MLLPNDSSLPDAHRLCFIVRLGGPRQSVTGTSAIAYTRTEKVGLRRPGMHFTRTRDPAVPGVEKRRDD